MRAERVVFDTNVLISAALQPNGTARATIDAVRRRRGMMLFSRPTFEELRTRLSRPKFDRYLDDATRVRLLAAFESAALWVSIKEQRLGCRDPDDDKFLETAAVGGADAIVTGDRDLLVMSPFRGIPILEPRPFLETLDV